MAWKNDKLGSAVDAIAGVEGDLLHDAILSTIASGNSITFSATKDGTTVSVILYEGKEKSPSYSKTSEELTDTLVSLTTYLGSKASAK